MPQRHVVLPILVLTILSTIHAYGQKASYRMSALRFEDYPVKHKAYSGKNHALILTGETRMFKTRLREAAGTKPNFAGHYIVTVWGCGSGCVMGAIIDAATGRIFALPFSICCWENTNDEYEPVEFRLGSNLIAFNGARAEKQGDVATHFYKFENNKLIFLKSVKAPA